MAVHAVSWLILLLLAGAFTTLGVVGLVLFLVLRKKRPPRGFDVLTSQEQQPH
jgi:hypothetical protein